MTRCGVEGPHIGTHTARVSRQHNVTAVRAKKIPVKVSPVVLIIKLRDCCS